MKPKISASAISSHSELLVKLMSYRPTCSGTMRLHRELVHRVDLAFGRHVASYLLTIRPGRSPGGVFEIRMTFPTPTPNPTNSISRNNVGKVPNSRLSRPHPMTAATHRSADQMTEHQLPDPSGRIWLLPCRSASLPPAAAGRAARSSEFEPCVWWKLRILPGLVLAMVFPYASPRHDQGVLRRARNMAATEAAKAPPLYEGGGGKSTAAEGCLACSRRACHSSA